MPTYAVEAVAYAKDGRRLSGNVHTIVADNMRDAERLAASRQRSHVETARVDTRVVWQKD